MRRILIPLAAFFAGALFIAGIYFRILIWAQGTEAAIRIFLPNRLYGIPIWLTFGGQVALFSILRFRLLIPTSTHHTGSLMSASGGTSVTADLSMDLAQLATITTDAGITVQAAKWDAIPGGHHVSSTLIFPSTQDGKSILEGASKLTLTVVNVDAASRVLEWQLK